MKALILMRHAEAGWAGPEMDDHDRTLSARGRLAAPVMAHWLEAQWLETGLSPPGRVLCSPARRTRETAARMREAVPSLPDPEVSEALYHAGPATIMDHLRRLPAACDSVLVIGHEPGLGNLLRILDGRAGPRLSRAYSHFPAAAMAVLEADIDDWGGIGADSVKFVAFTTPHELS